jgi:hypothetical protein
MSASLAMAADSLCLLGALGGFLPSFDWQAAATVGGIVAISTVIALVVAIATPGIAIVGGGYLATAVAVVGIAAVTGTVAGGASGLYWGHQGDLKRQEITTQVMQLGNHLDIYFEPSPDDVAKAAEFRCTIVSNDEAVDGSGVPFVKENSRQVAANNGNEFYQAIDGELRRWFAKRVLGDEQNLPRIVTVYMRPHPGEGVWDRLQTMVQEHGGTPTRTDGPRPIRQNELLR